MSDFNTKRVIGNWKMHGCLARNTALLNALLQGTQPLRETLEPFLIGSPLTQTRRRYGNYCEQSDSSSRNNRSDSAATSNAQNKEVTSGTPLKKALQMAVCVPFPFLAQTQTLLHNSPIAWGVQDVSAHPEGAYTGEVSAAMAAEFGAIFTLVGHSERRTYHQEDNQTVAAKALRAFETGLIPVVCVGETRAERDAGHAEQTVSKQLQVVLDALSAAQAMHLVIAYEPVWAIGTGQNAQTHEVRAMHSMLQRELVAVDDRLAQVPVLYGGSVKPDNASALFAEPNVDGGLIGGASLKADDFLKICTAAVMA